MRVEGMTESMEGTTGQGVLRVQHQGVLRVQHDIAQRAGHGREHSAYDLTECAEDSKGTK